MKGSFFNSFTISKTFFERPLREEEGFGFQEALALYFKFIGENSKIAGGYHPWRDESEFGTFKEFHFKVAYSLVMQAELKWSVSLSLP